jgi:hypothetical protein
MEIDEITSNQASPKVLSENEIQRLELKRLLGTAKTTERVEHIAQALKSLENDSDVKIKPNQHIAAIHPNHSHLFNSPKDIDNPVSQVSKLRPMSAQNRRPSLPFNSNLGVIPENKTLTHRNIDNNVETDITIEDIDDICSSSHDPRYPPINILKGVNSMDDIGWIPTGLVPQILFINFHLRWLVRKIEITCTGVEEISINIMSGARIASNIYKFKKMADDKFLFESVFLSDGNTDQNSNENGAGIIGKKIFIIFSKANTQFFKVTDMKIRAMPAL